MGMGLDLVSMIVLMCSTRTSLVSNLTHSPNDHTAVMGRRGLSGLQREVIALYRQLLRMVRTKPEETRDHWRQFIRAEFVKHRGIPKKLFLVIEHLIRTGHRRYDMYLSPQIKDIHS